MKTISFFPNTGHQYFFLKFPSEPRDDSSSSSEDDHACREEELPEQVKKACLRDEAPWKAYKNRDGSECKWIRWRYGRKEEEGALDAAYGIWVSVETNIGTTSRGAIYKQEEKNEPNPDCQDPRYDSPYASDDLNSLQNVPLEFMDEAGNRIHGVKINWIPRRAGEDIDVDIIVDFGNSRTVVLLLEKKQLPAGDVNTLADMVRPVRFISRGHPYERSSRATKNYDDTILDSWFVLHETLFSEFEPPLLDEARTMREPKIETRTEGFLFNKRQVDILVSEILKIPQSFVEMAPLVLAEEARNILSSFDFSRGGVAFMSSPKRYSWDNEPVPDFWHMCINRWNQPASTTQNQPLQSYVFKFLPDRLRIDKDAECEWDLDNPPHEDPDMAMRPHANPIDPNFPRSDAITWMGLAIIEAAYRQLNSSEFRKINGEFIKRQLRGIHVTFPSGWTGHEITLYRRKWQTAVNIFTLTHFEDRSKGPRLFMETDEALASQLPIIYSEIKSFDNVAKDWLELIGRGQGTDARARIMTIDIGGGTTDLSIVEYQNQNVMDLGSVDLQATLLFKDSNAVGGDILVKKIIEEILLPSLGSPFVDDEAKRANFDQVFRAKPAGVDKEKWKRIVRLVFIPKVVQWLSRLAKKNTDPVLNNYFDDGALIFDEVSLEELNEFAEREDLPRILSEDTVVSYSIDAINESIRSTFLHLFNNYAKIISVFQVDMMVVTGKPSELPEVENLLHQCLPLMPNRIISAKGYPVDTWYPFERHGEIYDAKTVTAVGAALHRAILDGKIDKWKISFKVAEGMSMRNSWVPLGRRREAILRGDDQSKTLDLPIGLRIGKTLLHGAQKPDPVYIFTWKDSRASRNWPQTNVRVKLERVSPPVRQDRSLSCEAEHLQITEASGEITVDGERIEIGLQHVELKLNTLEESAFWMDEPGFTVRWNSQA